MPGRSCFESRPTLVRHQGTAARFVMEVRMSVLTLTTRNFSFVSLVAIAGASPSQIQHREGFRNISSFKHQPRGLLGTQMFRQECDFFHASSATGQYSFSHSRFGRYCLWAAF